MQTGRKENKKFFFITTRIFPVSML